MFDEDDLFEDDEDEDWVDGASWDEEEWGDEWEDFGEDDDW